MNKNIPDYTKPDGKWGWFHYYNPVKINAFKNINKIANSYHIRALSKIFKNKKEISLDKINQYISDANKGCIYEGYSVDNSPILNVLYSPFLDIKMKNRKTTQKDIVSLSLFILLCLDVIVRNSKYLFIDDTIIKSHDLIYALKVIEPRLNIEKQLGKIYGANKNKSKREKILEDAKKHGSDFWQGERKYISRINLIIEKYKVCENTAKKYYKDIKKIIS